MFVIWDRVGKRPYINVKFECLDRARYSINDLLNIYSPRHYWRKRIVICKATDNNIDLVSRFEKHKCTSKCYTESNIKIKSQNYSRLNVILGKGVFLNDPRKNKIRN